MDPNNPAPVAEATQPVSSAAVVEGSAEPTVSPAVTTPSWKPEEVEEYKSKAERMRDLEGFYNVNPDLLTALQDRAAGKTKYQAPTLMQQTQVSPMQKTDPVTQEVVELRGVVGKIVAQKAAEDNEKEIESTIQKFPFLTREKLDTAHQKVAKDLFNKYIFEGIPAEQARAMALDRMLNTPLENLVYGNFKTELQDFLVKSKTSGALPHGVGSRGDSVNSGRSSIQPAYLDAKFKAYQDAGMNADAATNVVSSVVRDLGLDENDINAIRQVDKALRERNPKLLGG